MRGLRSPPMTLPPAPPASPASGGGRQVVAAGGWSGRPRCWPRQPQWAHPSPTKTRPSTCSGPSAPRSAGSAPFAGSSFPSSLACARSLRPRRDRVTRRRGAVAAPGGGHHGATGGYCGQSDHSTGLGWRRGQHSLPHPPRARSSRRGGCGRLTRYSRRSRRRAPARCNSHRQAAVPPPPGAARSPASPTHPRPPPLPPAAVSLSVVAAALLGCPAGS